MFQVLEIIKLLILFIEVERSGRECGYLEWRELFSTEIVKCGYKYYKIGVLYRTQKAIALFTRTRY
jgi:hypothetical protein